MTFSIQNESILNNLPNYSDASINFTGLVYSDNNLLFRYSVDNYFEISRVLYLLF